MSRRGGGARSRIPQPQQPQQPQPATKKSKQFNPNKVKAVPSTDSAHINNVSLQAKQQQSQSQPSLYGSMSMGVSKMTLDSVVYKCVPRHSDTVLAGLEVMWRQGYMADCVLVVGGQTFRAHRAVLAACAEYFHTAFGGANGVAKRDCGCITELRITGIQASVMETILECMYTGNVYVNDANVKDLLVAANVLSFYFIEDACAEFLISKLHKTNCLRMINIAFAYNLNDLLELSLKEAAKWFIDVADSFEFQNLEADHVVALLARDDLNTASELDVFKRALQWLEYNTAERMGFASELLQEIRLPLISPADIVDHVESIEYLMEIPDCQKLVKEALHYHCLPARQSVLQNVVLAIGGAPRTRDEPISDEMYFYNDLENRWDHLTSMPCKRHHHAVAVLGGFLYVAGGEATNDQRSPQNTVFRFDPRNRKWLQVACMQRSRESFQLGVLNGQLYAVGGRVNENVSLAEVEKYSPVVDQWETVEPLSSARRAVAVAGHNGRLYAMGGSGHQRISSKVERYNPLTGAWESRRPLSQPRFFGMLASVGSRLYLIGGASLDTKGNVVCVKRVEAYTPITDTWTSITQMTEPRAEAGCAVLNDRIFVVGGYSWDRNVRLSSVEVYDTSKEKWTEVAGLGKPFTGIGCCSVTLYHLGSSSNTSTAYHHGDARLDNRDYSHSKNGYQREGGSDYRHGDSVTSAEGLDAVSSEGVSRAGSSDTGGSRGTTPRKTLSL